MIEGPFLAALAKGRRLVCGTFTAETNYELNSDQQSQLSIISVAQSFHHYSSPSTTLLFFSTDTYIHSLPSPWITHSSSPVIYTPSLLFSVSLYPSLSHTSISLHFSSPSITPVIPANTASTSTIQRPTSQFQRPSYQIRGLQESTTSISKQLGESA